MIDGTISLQQAHAPLGSGEGRFQLTAGLTVRGAVRRGAAEFGVDWFEQKGWLDSFFVFRGPAGPIRRFFDAVKAFEAEHQDD